LLRKQMAEGKFAGKKIEKKRRDLKKMESIDYRHEETDGQVQPLQDFWQRWAEHYGESGFVNPRGDRLLTTLAIRAMRELRPRLMMINYTDPDYVHWGNPHHYTQAISIIDQELEKLDSIVRNDPFYCDNTILVIVPDCGRDSNPYAAVPFQHHFNSRSAHEIFALFVGPGIERGAVVDKAADQIQVASTIGRLMKVPTPHADTRVLEEVFA
jgi:phosphopentomutase